MRIHKGTVKISLRILPNRFHRFLQLSGNERISILTDSIGRILVVFIQIFKNVSDLAANLSQSGFICADFCKVSTQQFFLYKVERQNMSGPAVRHFDILAAFLLDDHVGINFANGVMSLALYGLKVVGDGLLPAVIKHLICRIGIYEWYVGQTMQQVICQNFLLGGNAHVDGITDQFAT